MTGQEGRRSSGPVVVGRSLPGIIPGLLPKLRRVQALKTFIEVLPAELAGCAAGHEIKLLAAERGANGPAEQVNTLCVWCSSATVQAVVEQQAARLIGELNSRLPYPQVEAVRCEVVSLQRIEQQLNNLRAEPD